MHARAASTIVAPSSLRTPREATFAEKSILPSRMKRFHHSGNGDFNSRRYAALARQFADNALASNPNEQIIQQIIVTRQIERNGQ